MKVSFKQAIIPRGLEHLGTKLGVGNRLEIQALQYGRHALGISSLIVNSPRLVVWTNALENRIVGLQASPLKNERAEMFKAILETTPEAITISNLDGEIIECSEATLDLHGFSSKDELIGQSAFWFIAESDREKAMENLKKTFEQGAIKNIEYTLVTKDGRKFQAELSASVLRDLSGRPIGFMAITRDITERMKEVEDLSIRAQVLDSMVEGVNVCSPDGKMFLTNPGFDAMFGYEPGGLIGKNVKVLNAYSEEENIQFIKSVTEALKKEGWWAGEVKNIRKDGTPFTTYCRLSTIEISGKTYVVSVQEDITERKQVEEALRVSGERYRTLYEHAPDGIITMDEMGSITSCNKTFMEITGYSEKDVIGKHFMEVTVLPSEDIPKFVDVYKKIMQGKKVAPFEYEYVTRDGVHRMGLMHVSATLKNGSVYEIQARGYDITERKRVEEEKAAAERKLKEQQALATRADRLRSLGEMAAGMAHEVNQPLVGVRGMAEHISIGLKKGWKFTDEDILQKVESIIGQADRMSDIIENLLKLSRADKAETHPLQVNDSIRLALGLLGTQFKAHGLEIREELADNLPQVSANLRRLEEVIINLLTNARQAIEKQLKKNPASESQVLLRTRVEGEGPEKQVMIEVIDTGIGIPQDIISNVFDPFFTTKGPDEGTGLGLSVSMGIIKNFGGKIHIQSTLGEGTTVTISLPAISSL